MFFLDAWTAHVKRAPDLHTGPLSNGFIVGPYPSQAGLKFEFILGLFDLLLLTQYQLVILGINDDFWKHHSKS